MFTTFSTWTSFVTHTAAITYLLSWFVRVVDFLWLDVLHDAHSCHHQPHAGRWALHGLHDCDIGRLRKRTGLSEYNLQPHALSRLCILIVRKNMIVICTDKLYIEKL